MKTRLTIFCIFFLFATSLFGTIVKFSANITEVNKDSSIKVLANFSIPKGWHIYSQNSSVGMPTTIELDAPKGFKIDSIEWHNEKEFIQNNLKYKGFDGDTSATIFISKDKNTLSDLTTKITLNASWLACEKDTCVPEDVSIDLFPEIQSNPSHHNSGGFVAILFSAFLGGIILNLMPCVFPVIGIKILSFAKASDNSRTVAIINALFYTLGIALSFLVLAVLLLTLRAAGESLGWGFQLQNPTFAASMAMLFFAMAMSFVGVFEIGTGFAGGNLTNSISQNVKSKYTESFLSGVLAVLVASPCTAPFMGGAVGAALSANISYGMSLAIFSTLGLGMSVPYILLSAVPKLSKFLPKSGMWLETFKKILSIPLFATVVWLVWLYTKQTGDILRIIFALAILATGLFVYGRYSLPHKTKLSRWFSFIALVLSIMASFYLITFKENTPQVSDNSTWSAKKVEDLRREGKSVYVDFTATWCLTCQYNKLTLQSEKIKKLFNERGITLLVGDWTKRDTAIAKELEKFGRAGVPLNLLYPPKGDPIILPAILTESALIEAIDKIK